MVGTIIALPEEIEVKRYEVTFCPERFAPRHIFGSE